MDADPPSTDRRRRRNAWEAPPALDSPVPPLGSVELAVPVTSLSLDSPAVPSLSSEYAPTKDPEDLQHLNVFHGPPALPALSALPEQDSLVPCPSYEDIPIPSSSVEGLGWDQHQDLSVPQDVWSGVELPSAFLCDSDGAPLQTSQPQVADGPPPMKIFRGDRSTPEPSELPGNISETTDTLPAPATKLEDSQLGDMPVNDLDAFHTQDLDDDIYFDALNCEWAEDDDVHPDGFSEESSAVTPDFLTEGYFDLFPSEELFKGCGSSDLPLYEGAPLSVRDSAIALLSFMLSSKISGENFKKLLSLVQLHLPPQNNFFSSLYQFYKYFEFLESPLNLIYYCSTCFKPLATKDSECDICGKGKPGYYIQMPLLDQVRKLYSRPKFTTLLAHRFHRSKKEVDNIEDIYDGYLYKAAENDILANPHNISLMWNTDGISLYKSSSFQIWPFYLTINELPPNLRHKDENVLLAGLAFGYEKPNPNLLLKPVYEELAVLRQGVVIDIADSKTQETVKLFVLCGTCDAPAKATFLRMSNFNGFYGCSRCLAKGEKSDRTGKVFVYPFEEHVALRSYDQYKADLQAVHDSNEASHGIKGPSYLSLILWSFFADSTAVDVLHCVYLGLCRQLFFLWFSADFIKKVFGQSAERKPLLEMLSKKFCALNAPHYMTRSPRSLSHVKYFKGSEFRTWLFSTSLPVLEKFMQKDYFEHYKTFVCAVALLNQTSVSPNDIHLARVLLVSFSKQFQDLFGLRNMSYNLHCSSHMPDTVLAMGPLWASSCFGFESLNGHLARLVHGARHAGLQIHSSMCLLRNIPLLVNSVQKPNVQIFCKNVLSKFKRIYCTEKIGDQSYVVGVLKKIHVLPPVYTTALSQSEINGVNFSFFQRLKHNGYLYVAEDYGRGIRNSSCAMYVSPGGEKCYGLIKTFVRSTNCNCENVCQHYGSYYAVLRKLQCARPFSVSSPSVVISCILSCELTDDIRCVSIDSLLSVCFLMHVDSKLFLSYPLNSQELE